MLGGQHHAHHAADAVAYQDVWGEPELGVAAPHYLGVVGEAYRPFRRVAVTVVEDRETEDTVLVLKALSELVHAVPVHPHAVD